RDRAALHVAHRQGDLVRLGIAVAAERAGIPGRPGLTHGVGARVEGGLDARGNRGVAYVEREARHGGGAAVVVQDHLRHGQPGLDVAVRDRAGLGLPNGDRPGAVGREAGAVAARARLSHTVRAGAEADHRARRFRAREGAWARRGAGHRYGEVPRRGRAPEAVHDVLDDSQPRLDV